MTPIIPHRAPADSIAIITQNIVEDLFLIYCIPNLGITYSMTGFSNPYLDFVTVTNSLLKMSNESSVQLALKQNPRTN